jgi:hypothetical protein
MTSPAVMQTSWLRVAGPRDAQSCAWCRSWVGRTVPVEMQASYASYHRGASADHACRCRLEPAELKVDAEDPGCLWA